MRAFGVARSAVRLGGGGSLSRGRSGRRKSRPWTTPEGPSGPRRRLRARSRRRRVAAAFGAPRRSALAEPPTSRGLAPAPSARRRRAPAVLPRGPRVLSPTARFVVVRPFISSLTSSLPFARCRPLSLPRSCCLARRLSCGLRRRARRGHRGRHRRRRARFGGDQARRAVALLSACAEGS